MDNVLDLMQSLILRGGIFFLQVEDYRNSTMIDCIMSISSDTLVLVDSSSKVRTSLETSLCFRWLIVKLYRVLCAVESAQRPTKTHYG